MTDEAKRLLDGLGRLPKLESRQMEFWRVKRVLQVTGVGKTNLYKMMKSGAFPKPVRLGPNSIAWVSTEVQEWMRGRIAERDSRKGKE